MKLNEVCVCVSVHVRVCVCVCKIGGLAARCEILVRWSEMVRARKVVEQRICS